ncbi:MAG: ABC transporter permease [Actinomycetota bacterium]
MDAILEGFGWLVDPVNWSGFNGIPARVAEHMQMTLYAVAISALIAIPLGTYIGHARRFEFLAVSSGTLARSLPSFGILGIVFAIESLSTIGEIGFTPTLVALVALAFPVILINTYVGVKEVDPDMVEAARGMGMTGLEVLRRLEVPLATPLMIAGIRTASVQVVATATLAAVGGWGGLGRYIIDGRATRDFAEITGGAILVAILAILIEVGLGLVERVVSPKTSTDRRDSRRQQQTAEAEAAAAA